jgi:hypothetical protein
MHRNLLAGPDYCALSLNDRTSASDFDVRSGAEMVEAWSRRLPPNCCRLTRKIYAARELHFPDRGVLAGLAA